eukprot:TRINITY_DN1595_c0_g1_i1.p1 TRINITY_DN1595_c0_g1~~TRINITY_DN1595_c0_g1_i1.p1  ORF type:complete len:142 (+),score=1.90 TRINITY_DN1595_c0_g1_i1:481-906(+)
MLRGSEWTLTVALLSHTALPASLVELPFSLGADCSNLQGIDQPNPNAARVYRMLRGSKWIPVVEAPAPRSFCLPCRAHLIQVVQSNHLSNQSKRCTSFPGAPRQLARSAAIPRGAPYYLTATPGAQFALEVQFGSCELTRG